MNRTVRNDDWKKQSVVSWKAWCEVAVVVVGGGVVALAVWDDDWRSVLGNGYSMVVSEGVAVGAAEAAVESTTAMPMQQVPRVMELEDDVVHFGEASEPVEIARREDCRKNDRRRHHRPRAWPTS